MRVAALDLGSNTFILLIAEVNSAGIKEVLVDETRIVRLGQNLFETGAFHKDALKRADLCLSEFRKIIDKHEVKKIVSAATSASRDAKNKDEFFALGKKYGIPIDVISGDQEARLTYLGAGGKLSGGENIVVIDVGGGSTEVVGRNSAGSLEKHSFNLGCVRLNEKYLSKHPIDLGESAALTSFINSELDKKSNFLKAISGQRIVAVAGTPTTIADIMNGGGFKREKIENLFIPLKNWRKMLEDLSKMSINQRLELPGMTKGREDVIISGMIILSLLTEKLGQDGFFVSTRGVRYGLAIDAGTDGKS